MIAATAFVLGATALGGGIVAYAADTPDDDKNPMNELVTTIAEKFGLNKSEVQTVVDDVMNARREEMQAKQKEMLAERLDKAVEEGKITQNQADLISKKAEEIRSEMEQNREEHKDLTPDERKSQMQAKRAELEKWAEDNDLTKDQLQYLAGGRGFKGEMRDGKFAPEDK